MGKARARTLFRTSATTYRISHAGQIVTAVFEPFVQIQRIIRRVSFAVCGHTEDNKGAFNILQLDKILLWM